MSDPQQARPQRLGRPGDFDFLVGRWTVTHRKLRARLARRHDWTVFDAGYEAWTHLNGALSVDQFEFPLDGTSACSVRTLDVDRGHWQILWVPSTTGRFEAPVAGGWFGDRGEFHGDDTFEGRPIEVRYRWYWDTARPRWEQAFRIAGQDWETNWTMVFSR